MWLYVCYGHFFVRFHIVWIWEEPGTASFDWKRPRIYEVLGHNFIIKFKQQSFCVFSCSFNVSKLKSALSVLCIYIFPRSKIVVDGMNIYLSLASNALQNKILSVSLKNIKHFLFEPVPCVSSVHILHYFSSNNKPWLEHWCTFMKTQKEILWVSSFLITIYSWGIQCFGKICDFRRTPRKCGTENPSTGLHCSDKIVSLGLKWKILFLR